jgi:hypothetical protein
MLILSEEYKWSVLEDKEKEQNPPVYISLFAPKQYLSEKNMKNKTSETSNCSLGKL